MSSKYQQPGDAVRRTRFFNGQFLEDQDFIDEQLYHVDRQRRHGRTLHVAGIAEGLDVSAAASRETSDALTISVSPGTAIDAGGRQIVLAEARPVPFPPVAALEGPWLVPQDDEQAGAPWPSNAPEQPLYLYIAYGQRPDMRRVPPQEGESSKGIEDDGRWLEAPELILSPRPLGAGATYRAEDWNVYDQGEGPPPVLLGILRRRPNGTLGLGRDARSYSGLRLPAPGPAAAAAQLRAASNGSVSLFTVPEGSGDPQPRLTVGRDGGVGIGVASPSAALDVAGAITVTGGSTLSGGLTVTGPAALSGGLTVTGPASLSGGLTVTGTAALGGALYVSKEGNVGVGAEAPRAKLHVGGALLLQGGVPVTSFETALGDSDTAVTTQRAVKAAVEDVRRLASAADANAGAASRAATAATNTANTALSTANGANGAATNALNVANGANGAAANALNIANGANGAAANAANLASAAHNNAANALNVANAANGAASNATNVANAAQNNANGRAPRNGDGNTPFAASDLTVNGDLYAKGHAFFWAYQGRGQSGTAYLQARDHSAGGLSLDLQLRTQHAGTIVEALHIKSDGNVGIGTMTPFSRLHIKDSMLAVTRTANNEPLAGAPSADIEAQCRGLPNNTVVIGGCNGEWIYFYWRDGTGRLRVASLQQGPHKND